MRLHVQTAWFENGFVFLPRNATWLADYVTELTGFPGTKYDDQFDSTTQALSHLNVPSGLEVGDACAVSLLLDPLDQCLQIAGPSSKILHYSATFLDKTCRNQGRRLP